MVGGNQWRLAGNRWQLECNHRWLSVSILFCQCDGGIFPPLQTALRLFVRYFCDSDIGFMPASTLQPPWGCQIPTPMHIGAMLTLPCKKHCLLERNTVQ